VTASELRTVELGIVLSNSAVAKGTVSAEELIEIATIADDSPGWDYAWVGDSLLSVPRLESIVLLGALASRTRRVRLGVGCLASLGLRQPLVLALQWASLDVLSGGRMTLAACTGPSGGQAIERELTAFGLTHPEKVARMEEFVRLLRAASTSDRLTFSGDHVTVEDLDLRPAFLQRPLPIWVVANPSAGAGAKTVERLLGRVARLGDGWMTFGSDPGLLRARVELLHELRGAGDGSGWQVCVYVDVNVNADERRGLEDATLTCRQEGRRNATPEQLRRTAAIGSIERCTDFVARLVEAGATHIALRPVTQRPLEQMHVLSEHVVPRLKALVRPSAHELAAGAVNDPRWLR